MHEIKKLGNPNKMIESLQYLCLKVAVENKNMHQINFENGKIEAYRTNISLYLSAKFKIILNKFLHQKLQQKSRSFTVIMKTDKSMNNVIRFVYGH